MKFDGNAAAEAALLAAKRKARGRPVNMRDTFIAGIALARRATWATRNLRHFDDLSVPVVNPWARKKQNRFESCLDVIPFDRFRIAEYPGP